MQWQHRVILAPHVELRGEMPADMAVCLPDVALLAQREAPDGWELLWATPGDLGAQLYFRRIRPPDPLSIPRMRIAWSSPSAPTSSRTRPPVPSSSTVCTRGSRPDSTVRNSR